MSDELFADDELPSLFADDDEDAEYTNSSNSLGFSSPQLLDDDELAELLRSIDDDDDDEQQQKQQQRQSQQVIQQRRKQPGEKMALQKKKKGISSKLSNKSRDARKEEVVYLRKAVMELETRLRVLKLNNRKKKKSPNNTPSSPPSGCTTRELSKCTGSHNRRKAARSLVATAATAERGSRDDALDDVWQEIARHQCEERDRSERENIRLLMALESQLKVARGLEKFLMLKAAASSMEIGKCIDLQRYGQSTHFNDQSGRDRDAAIFHDLLVGVEQMVAEVDAVYEVNGLARVETTQISSQTQFDPATGMRVEVCATKALPFGVHETGEAVWNHYIFAKQRMPSRRYFYYSHKSTDATQDTIVEDFVLELHAKQTRGSFHLRKVTRRVICDDRVVIVWRTFTDPLEFSEQRLSGLRSFEKGYIVIRKSASAGVTLMQPCHIMYPCVAQEAGVIMGGDTAGSDSVVGAISDFRLCATAEFVAGTHQMIENALLEQALREHGSGVGCEEEELLGERINGLTR
ncbi:hypothetical protein Gpo141_00008204 [Globisporangium polare]